MYVTTRVYIIVLVNERERGGGGGGGGGKTLMVVLHQSPTPIQEGWSTHPCPLSLSLLSQGCTLHYVEFYADVRDYDESSQ